MYIYIFFLTDGISYCIELFQERRIIYDKIASIAERNHYYTIIITMEKNPLFIRFCMIFILTETLPTFDSSC